jgi:DNA-binding transcriptional ArsR family regulator
MRSEEKITENEIYKSYPTIAELFLLFSRSTPLRILYSLPHKGMTLSDISKSLKMPQKAILPELMELKNKEVLVSFCKLQKTYYRLADKRILQALDLVRQVSQKQAGQADAGGPGNTGSWISRKGRA